MSAEAGHSNANVVERYTYNAKDQLTGLEDSEGLVLNYDYAGQDQWEMVTFDGSLQHNALGVGRRERGATVHHVTRTTRAASSGTEAPPETATTSKTSAARPSR